MTDQTAALSADLLLRAAASALRSYQHGNASGELAEGIADKIDIFLRSAATDPKAPASFEDLVKKIREQGISTPWKDYAPGELALVEGVAFEEPAVAVWKEVEQMVQSRVKVLEERMKNRPDERRRTEPRLNEALGFLRDVQQAAARAAQSRSAVAVKQGHAGEKAAT